MGLVSDAINSAELSGESETIGEVITWTAWSIMYLGIFITAIGYLRTNLFPNWLSGLLALTSFVMFAFLAVLNGEQLETNGENLVPPLWMINSLVLVILGIFTIRRSE
jgi:Flp pilus assembly protein protease CpaA